MTIQFRLLSLILSSLYVVCPAIGQTGVTGEVKDENGIVVGATVYLPQVGKGALTDKNGRYELKNLAAGTQKLQVSYLGQKSIAKTIQLSENQILELDFLLQADPLNLEQVVVTATRGEIPQYDAPVVVTSISNRTFEATQSLSIAEGLSFSPGLRLENNCQNCGFTQLRMNGLDGPYSQILINSRPVFSALAGVYGLEMIPANMVDRIEVVRGSGSVLYGGNAIAGTVNIITKDPVQNSFDISLNQAFINMESPDRTFTFNGSIASEDLDKGISFFAFQREREPWDANNDGFSEVTKLQNLMFGLNGFINTTSRSKLKAGAYFVDEFRRGGNKFELAPHQTDVTEQLQHRILSTNLSYEQFSADFRHKLAFYSALQWVNRDSYYGAGGRILVPGDQLTEDDILAINAYGQSNDVTGNWGFQYTFDINTKWLLTTGTEVQHNFVKDEMPGYSRRINQQVFTTGTYMQSEYNPFTRLTFLAGARFDYVVINGDYLLGEDIFENRQQVPVFVPRLSAMYDLAKGLKARASFAQGYRAPQAFDEDLHIETVGGAALFIQLDPTLKTERSNSFTYSLNYSKESGNRAFTLLAEGFYTRLNNPFILSDQTELENGIAVIQKRNGDAAVVQGVNLEANVAFNQKWIVQSGATLQAANYLKPEEIWSPAESESDLVPTTTSRILRTPNAYGYYTLTWQPSKKWDLSASGVYTGKMEVPHVIDPDTEYTIIRSTPVFYEQNLKIAHNFIFEDSYRIQLAAGVQNLFNSFQKDFDTGMLRDAGYVYGPGRPRTLFIGLKVGFN